MANKVEMFKIGFLTIHALQHEGIVWVVSVTNINACAAFTFDVWEKFIEWQVTSIIWY
jgi:hypothetical protein